MSRRCSPCMYIDIYIYILVIVLAVPLSLYHTHLFCEGCGGEILVMILLSLTTAGGIVSILLFCNQPAQGAIAPRDHETNTTGKVRPYFQGLTGWVAASESPPAYDLVIKSPPPYFNYPGAGSGMPHPAPSTMYYCYCGSGNATTAATACKPCNSLPQPPGAAAAPYILHVTHSSSKPPHGGHHPAHTDQFLPSYNDAVKIVRLNTENAITHL